MAGLPPPTGLQPSAKSPESEVALPPEAADALSEIDRISRASQARRERADAERPPVEGPAAAAAPPPAPGRSTLRVETPEGGVREYLAPEPHAPPSPIGDVSITEVLGMDPVPIPSAARQQQAPQPPREITTLEDLYAIYRDIGDGKTVLRVERVEPKNFQGHPVAGWLGDLHEQISMQEFVTRYGGERYLVSVIGPARNKWGAPEDNGVLRKLISIPLRVPGPPCFFPEMQAMNRYPSPYGSFPQGGSPPAFTYPAAEPPQIVLERMKLDEQRRLREIELAASANRQDPSVLRELADRTDRHTQLAYTSAERRVEEAREYTAKAIAELEKVRERNGQLLEEIAKLRGEVADAKRFSETEQVRQLKEHHERELRELKDTRDQMLREAKDRHDEDARRRMEEAAKDKDRLVTDYKMQLDAETRRHAEERSKLADDLRNEREMARASVKDQVELQQRDFDRTMKSTVDTYEGRIKSLEDNTRRELSAIETRYRDQIDSERQNHQERLKSLADAHARELRMLSESRDMNLKTTEATLRAEINMLRSDLLREKERADGAEAECRDLMEKAHKPPGEYLRETMDVAKNMLGMKTAEEARASGDEEFSLSKVLAKSASALVEKGPEMLREIGAMRAGAPAQHVIAQQQQAMQARQQAEAQAQAYAMERQRLADRERQLMMQNPAGHRPGVQAPPPPWANGQAAQGHGTQRRVAPPPVNAPVAMRPRGSAPPVTGVPRTQARGFADAPRYENEAPPETNVQSVAMPMAPEAAPPPPAAADVYHAPPPPADPPLPPAAAAAQPAAPPAQGGAPPVGVGDMATFIDQLSQAIRAKMPARQFTEMFVAHIGLEQTAGLLESVTAEELIRTFEAEVERRPELAQQPEANILTYDGKKYLKAIFKEAEAIVKKGRLPEAPQA